MELKVFEAPLIDTYDLWAAALQTVSGARGLIRLGLKLIRIGLRIVKVDLLFFKIVLNVLRIGLPFVKIGF